MSIKDLQLQNTNLKTHLNSLESNYFRKSQINRGPFENAVDPTSQRNTMYVETHAQNQTSQPFYTEQYENQSKNFVPNLQYYHH